MNIGTKLKAVKTVVTSKTARTVLKGQKHSPAMLFVAGTVGVAATAVTASRATLNLEDVLATHYALEKKAQQALDLHVEDYTIKNYERDMKVIKAKRVVAVAKLYAPALGIGVLTVACFGFSNHILSQRLAGTMAAYAALDESYKKYRERIVEKFGVQEDLEARYGVEEREVVNVDEETGNVDVQTLRAAHGGSQYAKYFDKFCDPWQPTPSYNYNFLRGMQTFLNDRLRTRGHVFLNEVYDALGMDHTKEGAVVGWLSDGDGDGYIDFGIFDQSREGVRDFVLGREASVLVDFNVDGVIWNKI